MTLHARRKANTNYVSSGTMEESSSPKLLQTMQSYLKKILMQKVATVDHDREKSSKIPT